MIVGGKNWEVCSILKYSKETKKLNVIFHF